MTREEMVRFVLEVRRGNLRARNQLADRLLDLAAEYLPRKWSSLGIEFKERVYQEAAERALASLGTCDTARDPRPWYRKIVARAAGAVYADVSSERGRRPPGSPSGSRSSRD